MTTQTRFLRLLLIPQGWLVTGLALGLSGCCTESRREVIELHKRLDTHEKYCPHIKACVEALRRGPGANVSAGESYHLDGLRLQTNDSRSHVPGDK